MHGFLKPTPHLLRGTSLSPLDDNKLYYTLVLSFLVWNFVLFFLSFAKIIWEAFKSKIIISQKGWDHLLPSAVGNTDSRAVAEDGTTTRRRY